jgi:tRNA(Ser,Leu) C12 N-acetylase TAN1
MKLGILGQCKGGNAVLWFELFNNNLSNYSDISDLKYICRNENELKANFNLKELFGKKISLKNKYLLIIRRLFYSRINANYYFYFKLPFEKFDIIHIQGNYSPSFNLKLIKNTKAKIVLQIMGSDFYQNYLNNKLDPKELKRFVKVLKMSNHIVCSRETSKKDLLKEFPFIKNKISVIRLGTSEKWINKSVQELIDTKKKSNKTIFLSTRGLYDYNNVDLLVEAFCKVFKNKQENVKLLIVNGYGNHPDVIKKINDIIIKYKCNHIVELIINQWIPEKKLMKLYESADYNFCIGSTDQLSISITYGFLVGTTNVLSPINTYFELKDSGYNSVEILEDISIHKLTDFFKNLPKKNFKQIMADREKARREHIASVNFKKFINLYKSVNS